MSISQLEGQTIKDLVHLAPTYYLRFTGQLRLTLSAVSCHNLLCTFSLLAGGVVRGAEKALPLCKGTQ